VFGAAPQVLWIFVTSHPWAPFRAPTSGPDVTDLRLTAEQLCVERGGRLVLSYLSFSVAGGAALVVTGPNGAGKSTLLRTIAGLVHPSEGRIGLDGGDAERTVPEQCHYFGHQDGLKTALSVTENLAFWRDFYGSDGAGRPIAADVTAALALVGLAHLSDLPAAYLSAGQRRRLSLARMLITWRPVWLLDEPTSALDAASESTFVALVNRHLADGGIAVAATHAPLPFARMQTLQLDAGIVA